MIKRITSLIAIIALLIISEHSFAQMAKTVVAEHFTNTRCGICSSRNPNLWNTLAESQNENVLHISYHPSSPFSSCTFSQYNPTENDGRVDDFYNQYGSTPKMVVNGTNIVANSTWGNANLFDSYLSETSALNIEIEQFKNANEIEIAVTVQNVADHNLSDLIIFAAVAEDTIFYNAPNGENEHHNVFRNAFTNVEGEAITLNGTNGESASFTYTLPVNSEWDYDRIFSYVIIQNSVDKSVVQAKSVPASQMDVPVVSIFDENEFFNQIYPNPVKDILNIKLGNLSISNIEIFNIAGEKVNNNFTISNQQINLSSLQSGVYIVQFFAEEGNFSKKIIKE